MASSIAICLSLLAVGLETTAYATSAVNEASMRSTDAAVQQSNTSTLSQSNSGSVLFHCTTALGKEIDLYDRGDTIEYSFGVADQPEIVLNRLREETSTYQWAGVGRSMHYSVDIPNGNTIYSVFWSLDRLSPQQEETGGVTVTIDGSYVATVSCGSGGIIQNLMGVDLPPTRY